MRLALALGVLAACACIAPDARATAAVLFAKGDARVERHKITVASSATGTVTWDTIDVGGTVNDIGVVVAVKAGGRVELTEPGWVAAVDAATRVVIRTLPSGASCTPVTVGGGVEFDAGGSSGGTVSSGGSSGKGCGGGGGTGSTEAEGSSGGGCGCSDDKPSAPAPAPAPKPESRGGCLTSSEGCGSCDSNGEGCSCEPSDNGHPGCSAIHGCAPADNIGDPTRPRVDGGSSGDGGTSGTVGPYEVMRIRAADGSASAWIAKHGYDAPTGFIDGIIALEAAGYEVQAFRARSPESPQIVRSLRVVTTSPSATVPLRLVRMSTGADAAPTPVTLIALASGARELVGQTLVTIDETKLTSSNYESLVSSALGAPPDPGDGGTGDAGGDAGAPSDAGASGDGGARLESRWIFESSRVLVTTRTTSGDAGGDGGAASTLGDLFRQECGETRSEPHLVCSESQDDDAGGVDGGDVTDAGDAGVDAGASTDAGASSDAGASDAGSDGGLDPTCKSVPRQRCDDLTLALSGGTGTASRFRGLVGGTPASVDDLALAASTTPLRDARFTVRANGEAGTCVSVSGSGSSDQDGVKGDVSGEGSTACKTTRRSRYRIDLGPLVTILVAVRVLAFIMRRKRSRPVNPRRR